MCSSVHEHARVSECMGVQVHKRVCVCVFVENTGRSLSPGSDAVLVHVGHFGAGEHRVRELRADHRQCFIALQPTGP